MAHIHRLISFFLCCLSFSVGAAFPPASSKLWKTNGWFEASTAQASCSAFAAAQGVGAGTLTGGPDSYTCNAGTWHVPTGFTSIFSCPANSSLSAGSCTCSASFSEFNGTCISAAENCKSVASLMSTVGSFTAPGGGLSLCYGGCSVTAYGSTTGQKNGVNQPTQYHGPFTSDGTTCTTNEASKSQLECPMGSVSGEVNGVTVCSPDPGSNVVMSGPKTTASAPSPAASAPSGSASSPSAPSVGSDAPAGATSSKTTTTCKGSECTTKKEFYGPDGKPLGETLKTESQNEFCASNPGAAICQKSGTFSGTCGSPPACSGDAVMCATAAAAFQTNCSLQMPESSSENSAYDFAKSKTGDQTTGLPGNASIDLGPASFNQTNILGAGSGGMRDVTITVHGQGTTIPFSSINVWLERLGYLLKAVTFLVCAYIVTGTRQGSA